MPPQALRPYQQEGLANVLDAFRGGARSVLCILPTGGGKTTLFSHLIAGLHSRGKRAVVLVHRRELAEQACKRLREFGVPHGLIMAGEVAQPWHGVQVASVQTLTRRTAPAADLVVCDEAHLSTAATWASILSQYPAARILGVTATPWRLSGKPLAGAYDASVVVASPAQLRERGFLCDYVGFSYRTPDLSSVKTTAGEYNERESAAAMGQSAIVDNVVEEWGKHARELSTVVFAVTVGHSRQLTDAFRASGVAAEHLDGAAPLELRKAILRRVELGQTRVLCNVGVAVEGLDIPRLKCCVLARPTKSVSRYLQMVGRVRRPWEGVSARIHDHAFCIAQHDLPDAERDYSLTAKAEAPPSLSTCSECFALNPPGQPCRNCGAERKPVEAVREGPEMLGADEVEQFGFESGEEAAPTPPVVERPPVRVTWNRHGQEVKGDYRETWVEENPSYKRRWYRLHDGKRARDVPGGKHLDMLMAKVPAGSRDVVITYKDTASSGMRIFDVSYDDGTPEGAP